MNVDERNLRESCSYRVIHERGISEFLFAATHYTHCNNILISNFENNYKTESTTALSPVYLTLKQKIFLTIRKICFYNNDEKTVTILIYGEREGILSPLRMFPSR
jgi:hypothetical protein